MDKVNSLSELIKNTYGVEVSSVVNKTVSEIGATVTKIVNNNPKRVSLLIVNLSDNDVHIMIDNQVSSSRGIYLAPGGGAVNFDWSTDFTLISHDWFGIAAAAASPLLIVEGVLQ